MPRLSCIITTYKSYTYKGGCIEHTLEALEKQNFTEFEVIILENSGECVDRILLESFLKKRTFSFVVKLVKTNNYAVTKARNLVVNETNGDILVFIEDDTILITADAMHSIAALGKDFQYGLGAKRLWTQPLGWFEANSEKLLQCIRRGDFTELVLNVGKADPAIRGFENIDVIRMHMERSYIANFGFVKKSSFHAAGGFPENFNDGIGHDDTALMLMLYLQCGAPCLLSHIEVVHVNHELRYDKLLGSYSSQHEAELEKLYETNGILSFNLTALLFPQVNKPVMVRKQLPDKQSPLRRD